MILTFFLNRVEDNINGYKTAIDKGIIGVADGDFGMLADMAFFGYEGYVKDGYSESPSQSLGENTADAVMTGIPFLISRKIGRGHAYKKHVVKQKEFPKVKSQEQLVNIVMDITSDVHSQHKILFNGRET